MGAFGSGSLPDIPTFIVKTIGVIIYPVFVITYATIDGGHGVFAVVDNKNDAQEAINLVNEQAVVIGAWSIEKVMGECRVPSAK